MYMQKAFVITHHQTPSPTVGEYRDKLEHDSNIKIGLVADFLLAQTPISAGIGENRSNGSQA